MAVGTVVFIIVLLVIVAIVAYIIGKRVAEQKKWGERKAQLEKQFLEEKSELEKQILEAENEKEKTLGDLRHQQALKLAELEKKYSELIKGFRKDAVSRSRNTLLGKLWEQIVPYLPSFKHNPADMRFIGSPIDYIIFEGMDKKNIQRVVFLEVKTRGSKLNPQEKKLKDAIEKKRVKWEEVRFDELTQTEIPQDKEMDKIVDKELASIKEEFSEGKEDLEGNEDSEGDWECEYCGKSFDLNKETQRELEEEGSVTVHCPHCSREITCEDEGDD